MSALARLATAPAGRRGKWVALAVWLLVLVLGGLLAGRLEEVQTNDVESFLPAEAESVQALELQRAAGSDALPAVVLYERPGGLTPDDLAAVTADREAALAAVEVEGQAPPPIPSPDGEAVQLVLPLGADDGFALGEDVQELRALVQSSPDGGTRDDGLSVWVTGPGGLQGDFLDVFETIDSTLLLATAAIVVVVLLVTYRSPVLWLLPLVSVAAAEISSRGLVVLLADGAGLVVNGQSAAILSVLVFGAGTDYALLLVSRYREELRILEDRHEAMAVALRQAGPAVLASGGTVVAAMLCLLVADDAAVRGLGPVAAVGITMAMASMLTFLPALLVLVGRPAFWPFVPRHGALHDETATAWGRLGTRVGRRPRFVWVTTTAVLAALWLGLSTLDAGGLSNEQQFRGTAESIAGEEALARHYPVGTSTPLNVLSTTGDAEALAAVLEDDPGVASVVPVGPVGEAVQVDAVLADPADSDAAYATVERLRTTFDDADPAALVGGTTALNLDVQDIAQRDRAVIIPLVLVVVLLIIVVLLRSLAAPVLLLLTTVLSFGAALGLSALLFQHVLGIDSADSSFPLFAFIFLVALGVDYNIFLMTRAREETARLGTRPGMVRALAVTGGVITSAGVVLAATFSVLGVLPLTFLTQLGLAVALGVLLDALVVRSILVPALVLDIGPRTWWPSRLAREGSGSLPAARPHEMA
ncbi:MAG TPA: MMPL family transporter [Mycobacteriales bacterium]|nr:MMPL family transporter [Mycobacteriales bacterium]